MTKSRKSYYSELGVQPDATQGQIRDAYRRLAKRYHPDTNRSDPKAEERFKRIGEAYRVLSDPNNRLVYQQKESIRTRAKAAAKRRDTAHFSDLFKKVFQTGFGTTSEQRARQAPRRGKDLQISLDLDLMELSLGVKKKVIIKRETACEVCGGNGLKPGHSPVPCSICLGIGEVPTSRNGKTVFITCKNCKGTGHVIRDRCIHCGGSGVARGSCQLTIDIPPGTKPGETLTIRKQGNSGRGGAASGDLKVLINQIKNPYFEPEGSDIVYEYPLNLLEVMLGGEIQVPTAEGRIKLNLQPGLHPDQTLKVKGKGLPKSDGSRGDLLVKVRYHLPHKLTIKARRLLEELVELPGWSPRRDKDGFVKRD